MPPPASAPEDLKPLTALRFFAAAWVVAFDYWPRLTPHVPVMLRRGHLGVEVFFVLSGFILSHVYGRKVGEGGFRYGGFLWARLARIYPVHLTTLAGLGLLVAAARMGGAQEGEGVVRLGALPAELTLTHAWGFAPIGGWNHPSWSLSAEWFAYLSFPAFAAAAWALRARPRLATALAVAAGAADLPRLPPGRRLPALHGDHPLRLAARGSALRLRLRPAPAVERARRPRRRSPGPPGRRLARVGGAGGRGGTARPGGRAVRRRADPGFGRLGAPRWREPADGGF